MTYVGLNIRIKSDEKEGNKNGLNGEKNVQMNIINWSAINIEQSMVKKIRENWKVSARMKKQKVIKIKKNKNECIENTNTTEHILQFLIFLKLCKNFKLIFEVWR